MDDKLIYEQRRLDLLDLKEVEQTFTRIAKNADIDPNYLRRCAYEDGKNGKKNIADKILRQLDSAYPGWRKRELEKLKESLSKDGQSAFLDKVDHFIREPSSLSYTLSATEKDVLERVEKLIKKDPKNLDEITNFITFLEHKSKD